MFGSIFDTGTGGITAITVLLSSGTSIVLGLVIAFVYMRKGNYTKNFVITLAMLPMLVHVVIMMVNGNLGTSVAILGAFGLVRFRSIPGTSREIINIFFAMAVGLATGMGFLVFAAGITCLVALCLFVLGKIPFGEVKADQKELKITLPENLDYTEIFDDIFEEFTYYSSLEQVKTTNLGSMYELNYKIVLKDMKYEKEMIDQIRCRNGNLNIICKRAKSEKEEL